MIRPLKTIVVLSVATLVLLGASELTAADDVYDLSFTSIEGTPLPLSSFRGKLLLVVNTASLCGFTPQYAELQTLWERYRGRGLVVLGVPSNDFGGQEPGKDADIKEFCETNFHVDFPLTSKERIVGDQAHPFYKWAVAELGAAAQPRWNFHKYLVSTDGRLIDWFSTMTSPTSACVVNAIEPRLPQKQDAAIVSPAPATP